MKRVIVILIKLYQWIISPLLSPVCRFTPNCSNYALEAVQKYGAIKGSQLAVKRVLRCHPFSAGGYDPLR